MGIGRYWELIHARWTDFIKLQKFPRGYFGQTRVPDFLLLPLQKGSFNVGVFKLQV